MIAIISLSALGILWMLGDILPIRKLLFPLTILGFLGAVSSYFFSGICPTPMLIFNAFSCNFSLAILLFSFIGICVVHLQSKHTHTSALNSTALICFSTVGALITAAFSHLMMLFLGIEILSIPLYVLASSKKDSTSLEAGLKYFILGAFASAIMLFGMGLLYAGTGKLYLAPSIGFSALSSGAPSLIILAGFFLLVSGLCFKIGCVPFQAWVPDVYQGSPTVYTGLMATMVKIAGFIALLKILILFSPLYSYWGLALGMMAILSMALGNGLALHQISLKRLFAYSSIAHVGYMMMTFLPLTESSIGTLLFYLVAYSLASVGIFFVILILENEHGSDHYSNLHGLLKRNPLLAVLMLVSVLSLAGIPPLPGFFGKYLVLVHALDQKQFGLVLIAMVNFLVGIYYYFRVIFGMYTHADQKPPIVLSKGYTFLALVLLALNIFLVFSLN